MKKHVINLEAILKEEILIKVIIYVELQGVLVYKKERICKAYNT
jgi:hypothetical protein